MPVILDIEASDSEDEVVAVGTGQFKRRSPGAGREWMNEDEVPGSADEAKRVNGNSTAAGQNGTKRRRGAA